ncbi:MAG: D-glycero-beta-D-manno-heptose 1-phosphate adenylyltransferase [Flavitalea sp.]
MKNTKAVASKIYNLNDLLHKLAQIRLIGKTVSFTNGCFDILHRGHIASLSEAASEADFLVVGVNADSSTRKLKGPGRPVTDQQSRSLILASLLIVDAVIIFDEETPLELIKAIKPDVLVKGGDYTLDQIVGSKEVIANGGKVIINQIVQGFSSSSIIEKIRKL